MLLYKLALLTKIFYSSHICCFTAFPVLKTQSATKTACSYTFGHVVYLVCGHLNIITICDCWPSQSKHVGTQMLPQERRFCKPIGIFLCSATRVLSVKMWKHSGASAKTQRNGSWPLFPMIFFRWVSLARTFTLMERALTICLITTICHQVHLWIQINPRNLGKHLYQTAQHLYTLDESIQKSRCGLV